MGICRRMLYGDGLCYYVSGPYQLLWRVFDFLHRYGAGFGVRPSCVDFVPVEAHVAKIVILPTLLELATTDTYDKNKIDDCVCRKFRIMDQYGYRRAFSVAYLVLN